MHVLLPGAPFSDCQYSVTRNCTLLLRLQDHIQIAIVPSHLDWLPTAVREWSDWAVRRIGSLDGPPLCRLFTPPVDVVGILTIGWEVLHMVLAAFAAACLGYA
jgi:hypothetical protein